VTLKLVNVECVVVQGCCVYGFPALKLSMELFQESGVLSADNDNENEGSAG
jgi:hypothetical protein